MGSVSDSPAKGQAEGAAAETAAATVTVLLPRALASRAGNHSRVVVGGRTVREVVDALERAHPGMRFELCYETGELRPFVNVFVNGEHIRYLRGLETDLPAGATVHILPSVAGG